MPDTEQELPVFDIIGRAFRDVFAERFILGALTIKTSIAIFVLSLVMAVIVFFFGVAILGIMSRDSEDLNFLGPGIAVIVGAIILYFWFVYSFVSLQIAAIRKIALNEVFTRKYFGSYADLRKTRFCWVYVLLFLPVLAIPLIAGLGVLGFPLVLLLVLLMPLVARYKLSLAFIAIGRAGSFRESWRMTSGSTLRLWATDIVILVIEIAVYLLVGFLSLVLSVFGLVIGVYATTLLVGLEAFVIAYWLEHFERTAETRRDPAPVTT